MTPQSTMSTHPLESLIETAFERRADINPANAPRDLLDALDTVVEELNAGRLRVAEKIDGTWTTHQWIKKAVLLYFRTHDNHVIPAGGGAGGGGAWFDKVPLRFEGYSEAQFREGGFRVVPTATVRTGTFIGRNVILMPSYVNIGAYVDDGTMVDTWATVGSCAQIGKNVHLSGGVGIGGVLEPLQANPTIIEDGCFIGARSEIVEGVIVEAHSVLSMGVFISAEHEDLRPRHGRGALRPRAVGVGRRSRQPSVERRHALAVVRGHREAGGRGDAREDVDQRAAADVSDETLELAKQLVACPSITPDEAGCLEIVASRLAAAGFACERLDRGRVGNLWARHGRTRAARLPRGPRRRRAARPDRALEQRSRSRPLNATATCTGAAWPT